MKKQPSNFSFERYYKTYLYAIVSKKDDTLKYLTNSEYKGKFNFTTSLQRAMKFYNYKSAEGFINMYNLKCCKIYKVKYVLTIEE